MEQPKDFSRHGEPYESERFGRGIPFTASSRDGYQEPGYRPSRSPWRVFWLVIAVGAVMAGFLYLSLPVSAQPMQCAPHGKMADDLAKKFKEQLVGLGFEISDEAACAARHLLHDKSEAA